MVCEHCGKPVAPADRYCASCLTPRTPNAPLRTTVAPPAIPAAPPAPPPLAWGPPPPAWGAPAAPPPSGPAGFWLRFGALLIDALVLSAVMGAIFMGLGVLMGVLAATSKEAAVPVITALASAVWVVLIAGQWAYYAFMESSARQATLGKMALGLTVTDLEGRRLGLGRATGRFFAKILSGIPFNLGYLLAAFTRRKQALHDLVAGTLVVRRGEVKVPALVIGVVVGGFGMVAVVGIVAAIAIPNFIRYQLRSKEAEAPVMLRALHAAELAHVATQGRFVELELPVGKPGSARRAWSADDQAAARSLGWSAQGPSYFTYRVAVWKIEDGVQAFATCAEADLDGDGVVAAWVTWQPVVRPDGRRVAPDPPCAHTPKLDRPLQMRADDPEGEPVRVSPATVF